MKLVLAGHDYYQILSSWTLPMVLKANRAMAIQDRLKAKAHAEAMRRAKVNG